MTRKNITSLVLFVLFALVTMGASGCPVLGTAENDCTPGMITSPSGADCAASNPANQSSKPLSTDEKIVKAVKDTPAQLKAGVNDLNNTKAAGLAQGNTDKLVHGTTVNPLCDKYKCDSDGDVRYNNGQPVLK